MSSKKSTKGFSAIEAVIIGLVVAVLSLGGWYVWQRIGKDVKQSDTSSNTSQTADQSSADPTEHGKYVIIKEWGVRFEVPKDLRGDISYFINTRLAQQLGVTVAGIASKTFSAGTLKCAEIEAAEPRSLANLERQIVGEGGETVDPAPIKRIGSARFYLNSTACEEAIDREGSAADKQLLAELKQTVTLTLEAQPAEGNN